MEKFKEKNINVGLQILRMISCFGVIASHCYDSTWNKRLYYYLDINPLHVPNFMILSFFFYYDLISIRNIKKIIQRFQRLLIPYLLWPFIFGIMNNIGLKLFDSAIFGRYLSIKDYLIQIIICENYCFYFWYLTTLLFLSVVLTIIAFLFKKYFLFIIQIIGFLTYILHRSSICDILSKYIFKMKFLILTIRFTPIAVIGLTLRSLDLIINLEEFYFRNIIINSIFLYILIRFKIFNFQNIYIYPDVDTNIIASINFFFIFALLPLATIEKKKLDIIKHLTNYTGGIYYLHILLRFYLGKIFEKVKRRTFFGIFIIYFNAYLICFIGNKIFKKNKIRYLFN